MRCTTSRETLTAAFLTACNPGSEPQPAEVNAQAHARLGTELTAAG